MNETKVPDRAYKVTLILLLSLAALTTAMKELNRLHEMVSSVHEFTRQWRGTDLVMLNEHPALIDESCPNDSTSPINSSARSGLSGLITAATDGYVERMDYEDTTEPEVGAKIDLISGQKANHNVLRLPRAKSAPGKNLKEAILAVRRDNNWPTRFEFKARDRRVTLEIPMTMVADSKADTFENEVSPDVLVSLLGRINRKQLHDKNEIRRRELIIKKFERNISSRRAS
jgi:hypothetical protein